MSKSTEIPLSLSKLGIESLNEMQQEAQVAIRNNSEIILLSPTGTGKTLAFLLPVIQLLNPNSKGVQAMILAPSRELVIQIFNVCRALGSGYKVNAVYGGRPISKDKLELKQTPSILIGTPGRISDHMRRGTFHAGDVHTLILDEFDKSLEVGFEEQMKDILDDLRFLDRKILTSATEKVRIPDFVRMINPERLDYLNEKIENLTIKIVISPEKDKLNTLESLLRHLGNKSGIVFCNFKDTINFVGEFLEEKEIDHTRFYGGLDQVERERSLIKFRNGTHRLLLATDLAARGIDVSDLDFIIHYQTPPRKEEFTHRNGRTARMNAEGTAYVIQWKGAELPDFIRGEEFSKPFEVKKLGKTNWRTLFISGGRKDKISKGDIAGLFFKQGHLKKDELGIIEIKQDCAFVSVPRGQVSSLISKLDNARLKKKKVRIRMIK